VPRPTYHPRRWPTSRPAAGSTRANPWSCPATPAPGKTHLLIALGTAAAEPGHRVRYVTTAALDNELIEAADDKELSRVVGRYARLDLLCVDELGYVHLDPRGAELLFQIITAREKRASIACASKAPLSEWGAAVVDRLTVNAHIIETGSSPAAHRNHPSTEGDRRPPDPQTEDTPDIKNLGGPKRLYGRLKLQHGRCPPRHGGHCQHHWGSGSGDVTTCREGTHRIATARGRAEATLIRPHGPPFCNVSSRRPVQIPPGGAWPAGWPVSRGRRWWSRGGPPSTSLAIARHQTSALV